jgi:hypothetical protein
MLEEEGKKPQNMSWLMSKNGGLQTESIIDMNSIYNQMSGTASVYL